MKRLAVIFTLFNVFIVIAADRGQMPEVFKYFYDFPGGDLAGHFILMGIMTFFIDSAFASGRGASGPRVVIIVTAIIASIVTVEEICQIFLANRTFSMLDLSFSYLGIICAGALAFFLAKRKQPAC